MSAAKTKSEVLHELQTGRAEWLALLAGIPREKMTQPGVAGEWSIKDSIAHHTAWQSRPLAWLEGIRTGTRAAPPPWSRDLSEDETNAWIYDQNRNRPLDEILDESQRSHDALIAGIEALPEADVVEHKFDWLNNQTLAESLPGNTYEHYKEHGDLIRQWLGKPVPAI